MRRYCPHCGRTFEGDRCPCRPKGKRKPTANDLTRAEREPWRKRYSTEEYRKARQVAIDRQRGRCADCGKVVAYQDEGQWRTAGMGGELHHVKALCEGGLDVPSNLVLLCKSCHKKRDDARRKG